MQATETQSLMFKPAGFHDGGVIEDWVDVDSAYVKTSMTLGHTVPHVTNGKFETMQAADLVGRSITKIPTTGTYSCGTAHSDGVIECIAMIQADGSFSGTQMQVFVKKLRKQNRVRELLNYVGVKFHELVFPSHPGFIRFCVNKADMPAWMGKANKQFGPHLLTYSQEQRKSFIHEVAIWDGWVCHRTGQRHYTTTNKLNAEWVQTLAHLSGIPAGISVKPAKGSRVPCYNVAFRTRSLAYSLLNKKHSCITHSPKHAYCATTETGYFLCRHNGRIFITGNTGRFSGAGSGLNVQNIPRGSKLRESITAPDGYKLLSTDLSQIEARCVATLAGQWDLVGAFAKGEDVYCNFAADIYNHPVTKADEAERFVGKQGILQLGYQAGAGRFHMAMHQFGVEMLEDEALRVVKLYRSTYPQIPALWRKAASWVQLMASNQNISTTYGGLTIYSQYGPEKCAAVVLPNGMPIFYPDLGMIDGEYGYMSRTGRKKLYGGSLLENISQGIARIIVSDAEVLLSKYGIYTCNQVHDEIHVVAKDADVEKVKKIMELAMLRPVSWMLDLPLACETGIGQNYKEAH